MAVNQLKVHPYQSYGLRYVNLHPYAVELGTGCGVLLSADEGKTWEARAPPTLASAKLGGGTGGGAAAAVETTAEPNSFLLVDARARVEKP